MIIIPFLKDKKKMDSFKDTPGFILPSEAKDKLCSSSTFTVSKPIEESIDNSIDAKANSIIVDISNKRKTNKQTNKQTKT